MREPFYLFFQSLNNLLSVLSAFPAVYEVLADAHRPSTSGSEVEETITSREGYCPPECVMVRTEPIPAPPSFVFQCLPVNPTPSLTYVNVFGFCHNVTCNGVHRCDGLSNVSIV